MPWSTFGTGAATNPNVSYEAIGFGTDAAGTTVTANASANTKGNKSASLSSSTASAWTGLIFFASSPNSASLRWLFDISFDNGSTWAVQNLYAANATAAQTLITATIPIQVAAGSNVVVRAQCSTGSSTVKVAIVGIVGGTNGAPGFTTFTSLTADTTTTRPGATNVPLDNGSGTTWTELVTSTAATYGALMAVVDGNGTAFGTAQTGAVLLATGASSSEVEFFRWFVGMNTTTVTVSRGSSSLITKSIASGSRLSARIIGATPGTDNGRIALYGLS